MRSKRRPNDDFRGSRNPGVTPAKRPTLADWPKCLINLVPVKGIEPSTFALQVRKRRGFLTLKGVPLKI